MRLICSTPCAAPSGEAQEQGGVDYLRGLFVVVQPVIGLVLIACVALFPIRGERLRLLELRQQNELERAGRGDGFAAARCDDDGEEVVGRTGDSVELGSFGRLDVVDLDLDASQGMLAQM